MNDIELLVAGDFCPNGRLESLLKADGGQRRRVAEEISVLVSRVDYFIANMESPLTNAVDPIKKYGSVIKSSPMAAEFLSEIGVNLVTLATNHIMDYGEKGLLDTLDAFENAALATTGAALNYTDSIRILYRRIRGRTLAVINMTEQEFSCSAPGRGGASPFDIIAAVTAIREARGFADHVLLILHGGLEGIHYPSPDSVRALRFLAEQGLTAIIRHHPHLIQGHEVWKGVPIFYSVGHFLFDLDSPISAEECEGILVELSISVDDRCSFVIHPVQQCEEGCVFRCLQGEAKAQFMSRYEKWSDVLADSARLQREWERVMDSRRDLYYGAFAFPSKLLLRIARRFGLLRYARPSLRAQRLLGNILRCSCHRELLQDIIERNCKS